MARKGAVLVVDDEEGARQLMALALRRSGFEIFEASSGESALEVIAFESIDLVVLDVAMPGISGIQVVERLRTQSATATLPILMITGSGDGDSVIRALEAGADDFLPKPVRLDELVARVKALLRIQAAWSATVRDELRARSEVVAALGRIAISSVPEEAAAAVIRQLADLTDSEAVAVLQVGADGSLRQLAAYDRARGMRSGGAFLDPKLARLVVARARGGPWIEEVNPLGDGAPATSYALAEVTAGAPIYDRDDLVGVLTIGITDHGGSSGPVRRARLLASAIDYANVLTTRAGHAFADQRDVSATQRRLRQLIAARRFHPVFQPIVDLQSRGVVGYEALTRFDDGVAPDIQFAEADSVGLGPDLEIATLAAALQRAVALPSDAFLSVNVSPGLVLRRDRRLGQLIKKSTRSLVLELTEHVPITDYGPLRDAITRLGDVALAVDDAGAGYASFRHILELRPTYAKLDSSLIRGIGGDELRQGLAAGLQYFAYRTGCRLIAEGVESAGEADALERLGVEYAQGYLFGRPLPAPTIPMSGRPPASGHSGRS
jgi:EAL domain-containing protein (putative c-di-GMP-specific phosphodiesterase class I)/DNA-binding response OmpR family regulator